ncbi:chromosome partitioning protein, ParB family [Mesorhizobium albiziae]|uniref:Chromosome partitioning protein, ParB family n=1 Tax=Neomesorhizobium albiziae TaxID=335020 RepID=A0A1I3Y465_9HYPH|nr:ParB/RepB/Spo0J family partition protein [Mesorhizobium albiziae]GLS30097.1 chromosome partitioning protein ParB [Mesorhizobium albiziae]SFK26648.1 chromosome partitioning protein, ParB family [Mesorhizobium albiziae]
MSDDLSKKRLGRGLAALIGEMDRPPTPSRQQSADGRVPIEFVSPNPRNPRRNFAEADLTDLSQSIREHGIVQPVVVRPGARSGHYEIIAGERRWRAAQRAGLTELPVIIRDVDDRVALELAIIENVQRADLNPVEEALGYQQLMDEHHYTQADLGQVIGKSRSHVANTLRLLKLPEVIRDMLVNGDLSAGHARTLVTVDEPAALAKRIVEEGLSVRQAEALAQLPPAEQKRPSKSSTPAEKDPDTVALEKLLSDVTGMRVAISHREKGGEVKIAYRTLEQLDELCRRLKQ